MRRILMALAATPLLLVTACGSGGNGGDAGGSSPATSSPATSSAQPTGSPKPLPWLRPDDQLAATRAAGLSLMPQEALTVHYHAHLDVFVDGNRVPVPAGLGINVGPNNTRPAHGAPGIAALHTHDTSGIVHIEAPAAARFTLGQVFQEWGVPLTQDSAGGYAPLAVYVDGKPYRGDVAQLVLTDHEEIAVVAGSGHVQVPSTYHWPKGY